MNYYPRVVFQPGTFYNNSPCEASHLQENQSQGQIRIILEYCLPKEQHSHFSPNSSDIPTQCDMKRERVLIHGPTNVADERGSYDAFDRLAYDPSSQGRKNYVYIYDDEGPRYRYGDHNEDPCARPSSFHEHEQSVDEQSYRSRTVYSSYIEPTMHAAEPDAVGEGIPAGYSIKHWDRTEKPIILLGSVFDANSLGKWIYDWTVFHLGASTPMADMVGELWQLLIKLAGKTKRAEECVDRIRNPDKRRIVEDFILRATGCGTGSNISSKTAKCLCKEL
ncbi:hypothetical protein LTR72_011097 [Exophiala xenobiotica]|nr:hypothetical protein LTR72_011097 [Exophiala xenobiotica]KAK5284749.1 hypothetical protein LTR14_011523 [Exophiala xenobiotica]KAK5311683.1 hypothetical protein LTR93_011633 [Exophiala xenobiotica]KAK5468996.1 hypothetical protein LTR55_011470 [Exophiala xenobiotica]